MTKFKIMYYAMTAFLFLMYWGFFAVLTNWWAGFFIAVGLNALQYIIQKVLHENVVIVETQDEDEQS